MRITLVTSPHVKHTAVLEADFQPADSLMYVFAPVGLLSLAAQVARRRPGDDVHLFDLNRSVLSGQIRLSQHFYSDAATSIARDRPDVVGVMTECDSYHHVLQITSELRRALPTCKIILGGPHASAVSVSTLMSADWIDAIVVGEGEQAFIELLDALESGSEEDVEGCARRLSNGDVRAALPRPLIDDLDDLPIPAYHMYLPEPGEEIFMEVGRGCPFQCEFCSTAPYWHRRHRVKSAGRVAAEVRKILSLYGSRRIHFTHDLFTTNRKWVLEVCAQMVNDGVPVRWTCSARADTVDAELLRRMAGAGCDAIYFGLESGSERVLKAINKDIPLEQSFGVVKCCTELGISANVGFIVGFPYEDAESLAETFKAYERALRMGCKPAHVFSYNPFADSKLYSKLVNLRSTGHFVDIPLGVDLDESNRARIAGDRALYGSFFRPALSLRAPYNDLTLESADEFSPLVEATLYPSLRLSDALGGLQAVFLCWSEWIREVNRVRGAAAFRFGYGSPALFAGFLSETLQEHGAADADIAAARALALGFEIAATCQRRAPTTMATYKSVAPLLADGRNRVALTTRLECTGVVGQFSSRFDVTPVLLGQHQEAPRESQVHLVWHLARTGVLRLLQLDEESFEVTQRVATSSASPGTLLKERLLKGAPMDSDHLLDTISALMDEGLLEEGAR